MALTDDGGQIDWARSGYHIGQIVPIRIVVVPYDPEGMHVQVIQQVGVGDGNRRTATDFLA